MPLLPSITDGFVATVLGDYVYFDGGELSELVNGTHPANYLASYPGTCNILSLEFPEAAAHLFVFEVNSMISIDLRYSWTNKTVSLHATPKTDVPTFNTETLWPDISSSNFYMWGGWVAYRLGAPVDVLWEFTADGNGGGTWASVKPGNAAVFSELVRPHDCAFCVVNNTGYCLGGVVESDSDPSLPKGVSFALQGVVSYNIDSHEWDNASSAGIGEYGTTFSSRAEHIPFGPSGLILVLGGLESPVGNPRDKTYVDFQNLWVWDPSSKSRLCSFAGCGWSC